MYARVVTLVVGGLLAAAPVAEAGTKSLLVIKGRGFGHGVGMSQWGAYGYAMRGVDYRSILAHYYTGTSLGQLPSEPEIRVLLRSATSSATFTGASRAPDRDLDPAATYRVERDFSGRVVLLSDSGRELATYDAPLRVSGAGTPVVLGGLAGNGVRDGAYRAALEFRPNALKGVDSINALGLEDYVRGVVSRESPASWPAAALQAQAVAARTYAITTNAGGAADGFDQYPDQRSQVYGGVAAETPATNAAVAATGGQVVLYDSRPAVTYFFSTSGGRTENVENGFAGSAPKPWLRSVDDPYDDASPRHRWGPLRLTGTDVARRLGSLVPGSFRGVKVLRRGASPRIMQADIVGSGGSTTVTGPMLRKRLGLSDSWAYFRFISSTVKKTTPAATKPAEPPASAPSPPPSPSPEGGVSPLPPPTAGTAAAAASSRRVVAGHIVPARPGALVRVQRRMGGVWRTVRRTRISGSSGRYRAALPGPGIYRVVFAGVDGPEISAG